jgi:hypothetical protein
VTQIVDNFLGDLGLSEVLQHDKEQTVQDVWDAMSQDDKDFQALIIGAALEGDDISGDAGIVAKYVALPDIQKFMIDFVVGNAVAEKVEHSALDRVDDFLAHYGVKGMKWGVIRDRINSPNSLSRSSANTRSGRASARAAVESGRGSTAKDTHLAALKSKGHRAINALTGDKTFWRRTLITAGVAAAAGVAVAAVPPLVLPASTLASIGANSSWASLVGYAGYTNTMAGQMVFTQIGGTVIEAIGGAGLLANVAGNTARAVGGNTMINRSYERIGRTLAQQQKRGRDRVVDALRAATGTRDKDLRHDDMDVFAEVLHLLDSKNSKGA